MIRLSLSDIETELNGELLSGNAWFSSVSTDSRRINDGDLFIALTGANFDGHDFVPQVASKGACAALVSRAVDCELPQLKVENTLAGMGQLAALWRSHSAAPLVAITGSNGKTSVKEMVAALLSVQGEVLATRGNLNNDIGLPLTLLNLQEHDFAVVEMGANHVGEIDYLSRIAEPEIVLINNAGRAHLEGFGSVEQVARAKGEIVNGLKEGGYFIYNADDAMAPIWTELAIGHKHITFGQSESADVRLLEESSRIAWSEDGIESCFTVESQGRVIEVSLPLAGLHNQMNATAAIAVALQLGLSNEEIVAGFQAIKPVPGRLQFKRARSGAVVIDDSYNANPESVIAAISVLAEASSTGILVLGELAELGSDADAHYADIARTAAKKQISHLYLLGGACVAAETFGANARTFETKEKLIAALEQKVGAGDTVLVKGSRSAAMEQVVDALTGGGER